MYLVILVTVLYTNNLGKPALMFFSIFSFLNKVATGKRLNNNDVEAPTLSQVLPQDCKPSI